MKRADFIKTMHATIDAFDRRWAEQQKDESENPENWPEESNEGDWLEQLEAHVQTTGLEELTAGEKTSAAPRQFCPQCGAELVVGADGPWPCGRCNEDEAAK